MKIELVSKNYNEGSRLVGVIEKKLGKLDKYFSGDADALVKLSTVGNDKFTMEITVRFGGYIARAEVTGSNMYDNIDLILPKLEKQIARFRDRMNSKVPKKALPLKTDVEEAAAPREYYGNIVKEKHFDISIVTVDEAIAEMIAHKGAYLLNVAVEEEGMVFPMIPAGGCVTDILLNSTEKY